MKNEFHKVATIDFYGEWEDAPPLKIKHRETLVIKWPDGSKTKEKVYAEIGSGSAQVDMNNHPDHFQTRSLMVLTKHRGVKVFVPLRGLRVARVKL